MSDMGKVIRSGERVALSHYSLDAEQWEAMLAAPGATSPPLFCWADEHRVYVLRLKGDCPLMACPAVEERRDSAPPFRFSAV